jgi:hypothetical protein
LETRPPVLDWQRRLTMPTETGNATCSSETSRRAGEGGGGGDARIAGGIADGPVDGAAVTGRIGMLVCLLALCGEVNVSEDSSRILA